MNPNHDPKDGKFTSGSGGFSVDLKKGPTPEQKAQAALEMFGSGDKRTKAALQEVINHIAKHHK